jgi:arsenate reductase
MAERTFNVLFLCTGNSARSVMAEALTTTLSNGRIRAFSAGSHPTGRVNPLAVELIRTTGCAVEALRSKSWDEFAGPDAPQMDFIVTVCDNAAGESCPIWPGRPISAHWGLEDPAAAQGSDEDRRRVFERIFQEIRARVRQVVSLPLDGMDRAAIKRELIRIGDGASSGQAT